MAVQNQNIQTSLAFTGLSINLVTHESFQKQSKKKKWFNWNWSLWSCTIGAMTPTDQERSQTEYLWEIVRPHITVNWYVTVTSIGWFHMKTIKSDDARNLISRNRQADL